MTCKDCISYDICSYNAYVQAEYSGKAVETYITIDNKLPCRFFKDKSRYIEPPCKVGDKVAVRAMCECVITTPCYEECRHICPFENDCECEECSSLNERIFDTTVSGIFNNGQGWYIEFKDLIPFARFADIGTSFFVGENAHEQAVAYNKGLAERSEGK